MCEVLSVCSLCCAGQLVSVSTGLWLCSLFRWRSSSAFTHLFKDCCSSEGLLELVMSLKTALFYFV